MRSRGLPEDHVGPVRVVTIHGVDSNMCCGTHVSNLSHLQVYYSKQNLVTDTAKQTSLVYQAASHRERKEE